MGSSLSSACRFVPFALFSGRIILRSLYPRPVLAHFGAETPVKETQFSLTENRAGRSAPEFSYSRKLQTARAQREEPPPPPKPAEKSRENAPTPKFEQQTSPTRLRRDF